MVSNIVLRLVKARFAAIGARRQRAKPEAARVRQDVCDVGDVAKKFAGAPGVPAVSSRSEAKWSEWGPGPLRKLGRQA
jgi:hypothetical protein